MPGARGVKRTASKASSTAAAAGSKNKKKRGAFLLEIPSAPKTRGRLLTCGQGDVGQLGLGEDVMETTRFRFVASLGDKIVSACAGGMHTVALDSNGKVWTFGCNDEGALGRITNSDKDEGTPASVKLPQKAVHISAGDSHTAALLSNGDVYAWGAFRDSHGSMGLVVQGREGKPCKEPVKIDIGETAAGIASGGDHLVILSTTGAVYTMGCGEQGQLGRLAQRSASRDSRQGFSALLVPNKVTIKTTISRVWAGFHATFAFDENNSKMLAWGLNNYGQLGITGEKRKCAIFSPTDCGAFNSSSATWSEVACGQHHSLALDQSGQVYSVGRCEYGRLGLGDRTGDAEILEPIPKLQNKKCIHIAASTSNSFAATDAGEVFAWGMGSEGQLGTGNCSDANEPTQASSKALEGKRGLVVCGGGQHTVLLAEDPTALKETSPVPEEEEAVEKIDEAAETKMEVEEEPESVDSVDAEEPKQASSNAVPAPEEVKPKKEPSPAPAPAPAEVKAEPELKKEQKPEPELKKDDKPMETNDKEEKEDADLKDNPSKRQKIEQEDEVSSTSLRVEEQKEEEKPQKVNGEENKETKMEVDEKESAEWSASKKLIVPETVEAAEVASICSY